MFKSTMPTLKQFVTAIRLPFFWVDVIAAAAHLTCIGRRNKNDWYACNSRFVAYELSQLVESPVVSSPALSLAPWLLIQRLPNISQVLKYQSCVHLFGTANQFLRDVVVQPGLVALFSAREPAEQPAAVPTAFALNIASNSAVPITGCLDLLTAPVLSLACRSNITPAQINANHRSADARGGSLRGFTRRWRVNLYHKVNVVVATLSFIQCRHGQSLTTEQGDLITTNRQVKLDLPRFQGNSNALLRLEIAERTNVQTNRGWAKFMHLFNCFGVTNNAADSLTDVIGFQPCRLPYRFIDLMVQLGCIPAILAFCYIQYLIAGIGEPIQSCVQIAPQLYRDYKLALYRQGLSHKLIIAHPCINYDGTLKYPVSVFLRGLKTLGFQRPVRFL